MCVFSRRLSSSTVCEAHGQRARNVAVASGISRILIRRSSRGIFRPLLQVAFYTTRRENRSLLYAIGTRRKISNGRTSSAVGSSFRDPSEICSSFLRCVLPHACLPSRKARDVINKIKKARNSCYTVRCTMYTVRSLYARL